MKGIRIKKKNRRISNESANKDSSSKWKVKYHNGKKSKWKKNKSSKIKKGNNKCKKECKSNIEEDNWLIKTSRGSINGRKNKRWKKMT